MRILLWHVHGSWTTAFVQGRHEYIVPVLPDRGPDGVGRALTWDWPASVTELTPAELRRTDVDLVILQRPSEIPLVREWLGRPAGVDLPAIYLEHNAPDERPCLQRHFMADRRDIPIVHVTHFNELFWDNGSAPTTVIEHGVIDPGVRYTGVLDRGAVVVNEPGRRGRIVGADLLPRLAGAGPIDVFGMQADAFVADLDQQSKQRIRGREDLTTQDEMHTELARHRVYLHPMRWTSLGLVTDRGHAAGHARDRRGKYRRCCRGSPRRRGAQHGRGAAGRRLPDLPARAGSGARLRSRREGRGATRGTDSSDFYRTGTS